jgi:hypothetical protein
MKHVALLLMISLLTLGGSPLRAQSDGAKTGASEPTVTIVTATGVSASVTFQGDFGPNRMEGTLISLPEEPIHAREGKQTREIPLRHLQEMERTPLGVGPDALSTYSLQLFTGESYILQPDKSEPPPGPQPATITRTMQVISVPKGAVELKTAMFGVVRIPFPKLLQLTVQPFKGALREAPGVSLPIQVLEGLTLQVPFQRITNFRRDPVGGTTTVSFGNAEGATGRIKEMPAGTLVVRFADGEERRIPLSDIVQYTLESPVNIAANPPAEGTKSQ